MIKESNPVTAKLECTSASAGGLVEINILSFWLSRSGLVLRIFISNKSPGDAGTAASIYHTLKTLHLISSQFQSDNADLSNLIQNTGCKVSARHGATQTPHVLKRARWLWIRTCHTITQTLKQRKTILGWGGADLDSSSLMILMGWSWSAFLWIWCSSSWLHIWKAWAAFKACMLRLHLSPIMSECLGWYPHSL